MECSTTAKRKHSFLFAPFCYYRSQESMNLLLRRLCLDRQGNTNISRRMDLRSISRYVSLLRSSVLHLLGYLPFSNHPRLSSKKTPSTQRRYRFIDRQAGKDRLSFYPVTFVSFSVTIRIHLPHLSNLNIHNFNIIDDLMFIECILSMQLASTFFSQQPCHVLIAVS